MKMYDKLANFEIRSLTSKISLLNSHDKTAEPKGTLDYQGNNQIN